MIQFFSLRRYFQVRSDGESDIHMQNHQQVIQCAFYIVHLNRYQGHDQMDERAYDVVLAVVIGQN